MTKPERLAAGILCAVSCAAMSSSCAGHSIQMIHPQSGATAECAAQALASAQV